MEMLDNFPFPSGWDTIISDVTQLKGKIDKIHNFINSMINDWAYNDYAHAYNASDSFSRSKITGLFNACGLFNNNPQYSSSLNEILKTNSNIINGFTLLRSRCIDLKEECDKIINYVNVINNFITSAKEHLNSVFNIQKNEFMKSSRYDQLDKKGAVTTNDFINWWNRHPYSGIGKRSNLGLKKLKLHEGIVEEKLK